MEIETCNNAGFRAEGAAAKKGVVSAPNQQCSYFGFFIRGAIREPAQLKEFCVPFLDAHAEW